MCIEFVMFFSLALTRGGVKSISSFFLKDIDPAGINPPWHVLTTLNNFAATRQASANY